MEEKMTLEEVEWKLKNNNLFYTKTPIANGVNLKFTNGVILQVFNNNTICFSGKNDIEFKEKLNEILFQTGVQENMQEEKKLLLNFIEWYEVEKDNNLSLKRIEYANDIQCKINRLKNILNFIEKHEAK